MRPSRIVKMIQFNIIPILKMPGVNKVIVSDSSSISVLKFSKTVLIWIKILIEIAKYIRPSRNSLEKDVQINFKSVN